MKWFRSSCFIFIAMLASLQTLSENRKVLAVDFDFSKNWRIINGSNHPSAIYASEELSDFLSAITGKTVPIEKTRPSDSGPVFILSHKNSNQDAFIWTAQPDEIQLKGDNHRGLLYAVYDFLEALGCRWVAPNKRYERIPQGRSFSIDESSGYQSPSIPERVLIIGHSAFLDDAESWIIWAARNKMNTIFIHVVPSSVATGAASIPMWKRKRSQVLPLLEKCGMILEYGGHTLTGFLPRDMFETHPEAFRQVKGVRVNDFNFCPLDPTAKETIRKNADVYFKEHRYADIQHAWPDDILGGGWCSCELCKEYPSSEQALLAVNMVAEVLREIRPEVQVSFLSYHDTEKVPAGVDPQSNVSMLWAPRKRSYAASIDDSANRVNYPHYYQGFIDQAEYFKNKGASPSRVFEYYLDAILFKSVIPPLPNVMQKDLQYYKKSGAHAAQVLLTGSAPFINAHLNTWLFPRLCFDEHTDIEVLIAQFTEAAFRTNTPHWPAYYHALENAFALALDLSPEEALPENPGPGLFRIFEEPQTDVGDPFFAPTDVLKRRAASNSQIPYFVDQARKHLEAAKNDSDPEAWAAENRYFALVDAWLRFDIARVNLYTATRPGGSLKAGEAYLKDAYRALDDVYRWGEDNIVDKSYLRNFNLIHMYSWELRLDKINGDFYQSKWKWPMTKLTNLVQMGWLYYRLGNAYH
ncbi:DUF4838 domain-containing protein [bacterium]|nr:DUF4838 domain-containing protein [bacterium]